MRKGALWKKRRRSAGFTLLESLIALLIVVLITACVAVGTSASGRVYRRSLFASESDLTAATLDIALSDVLRYAYAVECAEDGTVLSFSNDNYSVAGGHFVIKEGFLYLNTSDTLSDDTVGEHLKPLIGGNTYTASTLTDFQLSYREGVFSGSYTLASRYYADLSKTFPFQFHAL